MNTYQILADSAQNFAAKPALIYKDQAISFRQLRTHALALAQGLSLLGLNQQTKIGLYLPNCPEYVYGYLASLCLGTTIVPLDYMLKRDELVSCLSHADVEFVMVLPKPDINWNELKSQLPALRKVIVLAETTNTSLEVSFASLMKQPLSDVVKIEAHQTALIMYTSGTTGSPKGIVLTYDHLNGSPEAMKHFVDLSPNDIKLCSIPLSHVGGFIYIQNCIIFGITVVLMDRFNPMDFLRLIQQHKVTCFHIVPPMYTALLTLKHIENFDLSSLRWVVVFGAPSSPEILERFHRFCPNAKLLNGWGMTETCPPNTVTPLGSNRIESVGKPAPNCEIQLFDDNDKTVVVGAIGEIVIRGKFIFKEYYKDVALTTASKRNGWFYTGDLGRFDHDGYLYIVGRKKEMIKVGGQIVFAPEVESVFYKHEGVLEVAVIGVADSLRGEAVKAFVVLKPNVQLSSEELRYFAREHLANFKVPHAIEVLDVLPKNRTGKIDKEELKKTTYSNQNN